MLYRVVFVLCMSLSIESGKVKVTSGRTGYDVIHNMSQRLALTTILGGHHSVPTCPGRELSSILLTSYE